jgi:hypothetical protein
VVHEIINTKNRHISVIGAGFICSDIIHIGNKISLYNGGTCANVISALAYVGIKTSLIKVEYDDILDHLVNKTLEDIGVNILYTKTSTKSSSRTL